MKLHRNFSKETTEEEKRCSAAGQLIWPLQTAREPHVQPPRTHRLRPAEAFSKFVRRLHGVIADPPHGRVVVDGTADTHLLRHLEGLVDGAKVHQLLCALNGHEAPADNGRMALSKQSKGAGSGRELSGWHPRKIVSSAPGRT